MRSNNEQLLLQNCWQNFQLDIVKTIPKNEIDALVSTLNINDCDSDKIIFEGLSDFFADYVKQNYYVQFRNLIDKHFGSVFNLKDEFKIYFINNKNNEVLSKNNNTNNKETTGLKSKYAFKHYINSKQTELAYKAAIAVSKNIYSPKYNPLYIYGMFGLGKTHLLQAIGISAIEKNPKAKVFYCSAESFTNSLIEGIRFRRTYELRKKFRSLDLLLIDDIQFLENKPKTQEEFFYTLNELILNNKQIIITSDKPPKELISFDKKLISQLSSGIITKINSPSFETKVLLIKAEIKKNNLFITDSLISYIAKSIKSNINEIIGVIKSLEAKKSLLGIKINLESTKNIINDFQNAEKKKRCVENYLEIISKELNIKTKDLVSNTRDREVTKLRKIAMYIIRNKTNLSYAKIGYIFNKNHSSVLQSCKNVKLMMEESTTSKKIVESILDKI